MNDFLYEVFSFDIELLYLAAGKPSMRGDLGNTMKIQAVFYLLFQ